MSLAKSYYLKDGSADGSFSGPPDIKIFLVIQLTPGSLLFKKTLGISTRPLVKLMSIFHKVPVMVTCTHYGAKSR